MAFQYVENELHVEKVSVADIVKVTNTPVYCYSLKKLTDNFKAYKTIPNSLICYAVKANSNLSILRAIANAGGGADVVSEGEIRLSLLAGIPAERIVFSGVAKTVEEITYAIEQNIYQINVESLEELTLVDQLAGKSNKNVCVCVRLNPNIDSTTNSKITTGLPVNKFGLALKSVERLNLNDFCNLRFVGVSCHIGSGIKRMDIFAHVIDYLKNATSLLGSAGWPIQRLDIGGGLGISYSHRDIFPSIQEYAAYVKEAFADCPYQIICEPGRSVVGACGILVTKVLYKKANDFVTHVIVDAGMNDLMRPAMYGDVHYMVPVQKDDSLPKTKIDIVGPVCETGDTFSKEYLIQELQGGDLLAICDAGAYCMSLFNNYNARLTPAEVLVRDAKFSLVRDRETYGELLKKTKICDELFS